MLPAAHEKITTRGVVGMILARLDTGPASWVTALAMRMTSDQATEEYAWLGNTPAMREFIEGRSPQELAENSFRVSNKDYEGSILVQSKDMRRDKTGQIQIRVNQLSDRANDHPAKLMSTLIINGESTPCYDGQYFFDTDHSEGDSGSQSNDITVDISEQPAAVHGTTTAPSPEEMAHAIVAGIVQMLTFKDDRGEPMNQSASAFTVMMPIGTNGGLAKAAMEAVNQLLGEGGKSGLIAASLKGRFTIDLVINPRLTWTDRFAVFRTDEAAKPFILQEEQSPDVVALGDGSEYEALNKKQLFGIDWSGNVAYAYWQFAVLVTLV
jgi:phage major head subunit gpT-like protein